jgi:hypothetical protein
MCRDGWERQAIGKRDLGRFAAAEIIGRRTTAALILETRDANRIKKVENRVVCRGIRLIYCF